MPLTVRLTPKIERALNAMARRRRQTRSDVVREAIEHYTTGTDSDTPGGRPYHLWADVIGIVGTGGRDPGKTTGELFTELAIRKARARRPR
ncbi:MAG: CopG family transcriptional regulator [Gemmatimonadetes bacterium]|nr:CopG family transcriptional regulator [Gemmatimonadota bacterium]